MTAEYNGEIRIAFAPLLKRVVALKANLEYGLSHQNLFFFPQKSILAKMTTYVEAEGVSESKAATSVKQQIKWFNVVLLAVIHLMALYAAVDLLPRVKLNTILWCRWRPVCLLHTYTSI